MSARDVIDDVVDRAVDELTRECTCGGDGCYGRHRPRRSDPRVVAAALTVVITKLADRWDPELARAAADYARGPTSRGAAPSEYASLDAVAG